MVSSQLFLLAALEMERKSSLSIFVENLKLTNFWQKCFIMNFPENVFPFLRKFES